MTHRPRHSGGTPGASGPPGRNYPVSKPSPAPPSERGGGGYVAPSKPKPFVTKPSAPPSERGGGGYVAPPKKTKKVITPVDTSGDTGREKGLMHYQTTGLKELGQHRKKEVEKILSSSKTGFEKREEIKKRNLRGAIPGLMEDVTKDKRLFIPPSESTLAETKWTKRAISTFAPLINRMTNDANNVWGSNSISDAMRHLMFSAIYPTLASAHEIPGLGFFDVQDLHNNALREQVLQKAREYGGTNYENIKKAAFDMVNAQEKRIEQGLSPSEDLPITSKDQEKMFYPDMEGEFSWKAASKQFAPIRSPITTWGTKASFQGYIEAAKYATNKLMNWRK